MDTRTPVPTILPEFLFTSEGNSCENSNGMRRPQICADIWLVVLGFLCILVPFLDLCRYLLCWRKWNGEWKYTARKKNISDKYIPRSHGLDIRLYLTMYCPAVLWKVSIGPGQSIHEYIYIYMCRYLLSTHIKVSMAV